jgi:hypothetical protein
VSDWFPHVATHADDLAVIKSCVSDGINHAGGVCQMNTGSVFGGRPSLGAWVDYGLGTENKDLPGFVVIKDSEKEVVNGVRNWGTGFMPAVHQGVEFSSAGSPIRNLQNPKGHDDARQRDKLALLAEINRTHAATRPDNTELEARIRSYELAYAMQAQAPGTVDLSKETAATKTLYGLDEKETAVFGRNCLLARRLVERGSRFVQLYHTNWDSHGGPKENLQSDFEERCREVDQAQAALVQDLKARGLLKDTLVIWGGEFGRTPMGENRVTTGRNHHIDAFTMWFAGGGTKAGAVIGETDELGFNSVTDRAHVHDIHATMLHLLGMDHTKLTFRFQGRDFRLTDVHGKLLKQMLA